MSIEILRPDSTTTAGTSVTQQSFLGAVSTATFHGDLSDQNIDTVLQRDGALAATSTVVTFSNSAIPAGRKIYSVKFYMIGAKSYPSPVFPVQFKQGAAVSATGLITFNNSGSWFESSATATIGQRPAGGDWTTTDLNALVASIDWPAQIAGADSYVGELWAEVRYSTAPATPTSVSPVAGSTLATGNPTLTATVSAIDTSQTQCVEFQFAKNSAFTDTPKTVQTTQSSDAGSRTVVPSTLNLTSGTWYMRARTIDQYGVASAYTAAYTITVTHLPTTALQNPTAGITVASGANVTLAWSFSDPNSGDSQSAKQVIVENNTTGQVLLDTGKVVSSVPNVVTTALNSSKDIYLRWKVQVWDTDDTTAGYSPYQLFKISDVPVVTVTSPTASQVLGTGQPTFTWTIGGSQTQVLRRVVVRLTSNNSLVHDSGTVQTSSLSYTPPNVILNNSTSYYVVVTVTDTDNLTGSSANRTFTTSYSAPSAVTYSVSNLVYETLGYMDIDWTAMTPDGTFQNWKLYRRETGEVNWTLLAKYTDINIRDYHDWTAGTTRSWEYSVTQTADRSGVSLESPVNPAPTPTIAAGSHYWLINTNDETDNFQLSNVTGDSYSDDYEQEEIIVIGRGRKLNYGTKIGKSGTLNAQIRDTPGQTARVARQRLETLKEARVSYYLRNPFGDVWLIGLGSMNVSRVAGVGTAEFVNLDIPYMEVF
jgi:hypothetical protein